MTAPVYELGQVAYETFVRGADDRLPWRSLSSWVQAKWARVELESRKAEVRAREAAWNNVCAEAEAGAASVSGASPMTSAGSAPIFTCTIPVQVVSELNLREHWAKRKKRKDAQQALTILTLQSKLPSGSALGARTIWLTRKIANRGKAMDDGNLGASFKHVQDAVAKWLGTDDGKLKWFYFQLRGHAPAVEVEVWNF